MIYPGSDNHHSPTNPQDQGAWSAILPEAGPERQHGARLDQCAQGNEFHDRAAMSNGDAAIIFAQWHCRANGVVPPVHDNITAVSYTHLTLPTNREV